jgi:Mitochondrial carrier protein
MKFIPSICLLATLSLVSGSTYGGLSRSVLSLRLQQSPVGIGVKSAFCKKSRFLSERRYQSKQIQELPQHEGEQTRDAAVTHQDTEGLGVVEFPHIHHVVASTNQDGDELDWMNGDAAPTTKLAPSAVSKHVSLPSKEIQSSVADNQNLGATEVLLVPNDTRGGDAPIRPLFFWENMLCGAVSRTVAQTIMHPANTMKTILQSSRGASRPTLGQLMRPDQFRMLTRGAGANFVLSIPHGAVNFAVLEFVRGRLNHAIENVPFLRERLESIGPALDFTSSAISTICCSVVSTPQMMITDNIMAGNYPDLAAAVSGLYKNGGVIGFYGGWFPGIVGKIPSYVRT